MTAIERLQLRGIRRLGSARSGFRYRSPSGRRVTARQRERIRSLALPPAWTDVFVSESERAPLQAIGRDRAGRWQYRYSASSVAARERRKRGRLHVVLGAMPELRARVARDLRREGLPRKRVFAAVVRILLRCFLRPGSQAYARENGSIGVATLRPTHVRVAGARVTFRFPGKSGKEQVSELSDRAVARVVRDLLAGRRRELFAYRDESGAWVDVRRRDINAYLRDAAGAPLTAKDLRMWGGTLVGAAAIARAAEVVPVGRAARRKALAAAMRETAEALGNTPAVCRASYVSPGVIAAFERGRLLPGRPPSVGQLRAASDRRLAALERKLARLI